MTTATHYRACVLSQYQDTTVQCFTLHTLSLSLSCTDLTVLRMLPTGLSCLLSVFSQFKIISEIIRTWALIIVWLILVTLLYFGWVTRRVPTSIGCFFWWWCYQKKKATGLSILLSKPLYWGQAGGTSGVQSAEHVYTECIVLFSLALTWSHLLQGYNFCNVYLKKS